MPLLVGGAAIGRVCGWMGLSGLHGGRRGAGDGLPGEPVFRD
ncbi:hypothetical protein [Eikenella corrodens]|nr:hypothetical protein [Eikenella corrodens]